MEKNTQVKIKSSGLMGKVTIVPASGSKKGKVKVRYQTPFGIGEAWFSESELQIVKMVVEEVEEKKEQEEISKGKEPWKKPQATVKVNKGLPSPVDEANFIG